MRSRIAIVAALPREIRELVKGWQNDEVEKGVRVFTSEDAVVVCAGMGARRATLAATRAISLGPISQLISAGFVGALHDGLKAGAVVRSGQVIDAKTGERFAAKGGDGLLVTGAVVAGVSEKQRLRASYGADVVDMEAAGVARIASQRGIPFAAVKAVSDEYDFEMLELTRFVGETGQFREAAFGLFLTMHPRMWKAARRLASGAKRAAESLSCELRSEIERANA